MESRNSKRDPAGKPGETFGRAWRSPHLRKGCNRVLLPRLAIAHLLAALRRDPMKRDGSLFAAIHGSSSQSWPISDGRPRIRWRKATRVRQARRKAVWAWDGGGVLA